MKMRPVRYIARAPVSNIWCDRRFAINEITDENRVGASDPGGLSRRKNTGIDAPKNDGDGTNCPNAVACREQELLERELAAFHNPGAPGMIIDVEAEHSRQQQARSNTGGEQLDDRGIRSDAVDDHGDRRRDEIVESSFGGNERCGETFAIAGLAHARISQRANRRRSSSRHAGYCAEQRRKTERRQWNMCAESADH